MAFDLAGDPGVGATADRVVAAIADHAVAFAEAYPDIDVLIAGRDR